MLYKLSTGKHVLLEAYTEQPCEVRSFKIESRKAFRMDFGTLKLDHESDPRICSGCSFIPYQIGSCAAEHLMEKYGLTETEYNEVLNLLKNIFTFPRCAWCRELGLTA